ncbi:MAG: hypothetical protein ABIT38_15530 [Gemmatimonadaceae bacterium]
MLTISRFARLASTAAVATTLACSSNDLPSATEPISGSGLVYSLVSVENKALPATVAIAPDVNVAVTAGKLTLAPDMTWIVSHVIASNTSASAAKSVVTLRGTYTLNGTALTMAQQTGNTSFTGTYSQTAVQLTTVVAQTPGTSFSYTR